MSAYGVSVGDITLLGGELNNYLKEIGRQAEAMFSRLAEQTAEMESVAEALKATDQMACQCYGNCKH